MTLPPKPALFISGAILMAVPGAFTEGVRWAFAAFMITGYVTLILGAAKNGGSKPVTALTLLIVSNASFWLSFGLWLIRLKLVGYSAPSGIDVYTGPLAL